MKDSALARLVVRSTWISSAVAPALITLATLSALLPYADGVAVGMAVEPDTVASGIALLAMLRDNIRSARRLVA